MRLLGFIVAVSIGLALMQAAAKLAAWLALIAGLATFAARPRETIGCVGGLLLIGLIARFPIAAMVFIGVLAIARCFVREA